MGKNRDARRRSDIESKRTRKQKEMNNPSGKSEDYARKKAAAGAKSPGTRQHASSFMRPAAM